MREKLSQTQTLSITQKLVKAKQFLSLQEFEFKTELESESQPFCLKMGCCSVILVFVFSLLVLLLNPPCVYGNDELRALMDLKATLDPEGHFLSSWSMSGNPCGGSFEGVACNEKGQVANVSLQGKGLSGKLSPAIGGLKHLTGLYLHYNSLYGEIPAEIANLTELSDLYLNVNHLSGEIPHVIGKMESLQGEMVLFLWKSLKLFCVLHLGSASSGPLLIA